MQDKVAVVTGAGIGREIALAFARKGASVAIRDIAKAGADETAARIEAAGGGGRSRSIWT